MAADSGILRLEDGVLRYRSTACCEWDMPLADLGLLGEFTNQISPLADGWFSGASGEVRFVRRRRNPLTYRQS